MICTLHGSFGCSHTARNFILRSRLSDTESGTAAKQSIRINAVIVFKIWGAVRASALPIGAGYSDPIEVIFSQISIATDRLRAVV
jgi:hypothetical protein